jgi:hypothetical protein
MLSSGSKQARTLGRPLACRKVGDTISTSGMVRAVDLRFIRYDPAKSIAVGGVILFDQFGYC